MTSVNSKPVQTKPRKTFEDVTIQASAQSFISSLGKEALIVYSPTSLVHVMPINTRVNMIDCRVFERNVAFLESLTKMRKKYQTIVSLGGGVATDVAKYVAFIMGAEFVSIPSMLSTNAYATNKVALVVGNEKITLDAKLADKIIFDRNLIEKATTQNLYGLADVISIHTALYDWELAHESIGESIDAKIYNEAAKLLANVEHYIETGLSRGARLDITKLYQYIGRSGEITNEYGTGRPESGSEHIMANRIEKLVDVPHGISVSIGIVLMSILQDNRPNHVARLLRATGVLSQLDDYGIRTSVITEALQALSPRKDRYSVVDRYNYNEREALELVDKFKVVSGIVLA